MHGVWYFVFSYVSNSIIALPFHLILFSIHGIATSDHCYSSLPPSRAPCVRRMTQWIFQHLELTAPRIPPK